MQVGNEDTEHLWLEGDAWPGWKADVGLPEWDYPDNYWLIPDWDSELKKDEAERMDFLLRKMTRLKPKSLACPKVPDQPDPDASFPWPAQVQAFFRDEGIKQWPVEFCVEWWLESNDSIPADCYEYDGLSRSDQYRMGLKGGHWESVNGIDHWRHGHPPEPPTSWDSVFDMVHPAIPSRSRTLIEHEALKDIWRYAMPKLKRFGLKHLGGSRYMGVWLSDVRLALLSAYYLDWNEEVSGLEVKELPPLEDAETLVELPLEDWPSHSWYKVLRRMARSWAENGDKGSGARRPDVTSRKCVSVEPEVLEAKECHRQGTGDDPEIAIALVFSKVICDPNFQAVKPGRIKAGMTRVAMAVASLYGESRPKQIEFAGMTRSTFMERLAQLKEVLRGNPLK